MMKFIPGHLRKNLLRWQGRQWYHQRFDGSPYLLHFIAEAEISQEKRKRNGHFTVHYCFFENGKADWYIEMGDIKRVYTAVIAAAKKGTSFLDSWKEDEAAFYTYCKKIKTEELAALADQELMNLHDGFVKVVLKRNSSSSLIDGFALGTDELVAEKIKTVYEASSLKKAMKFTEVFSILTAPVHLSFINDAEIALLEVAVMVQQNPSQKQRLLQEHQRKFFWIRNNYVDAHVLDVAYFDEDLTKVLSLNIDIEEEIAKIKNTPQRNRRQKQRLLKKLTIPDNLQLLLRISEDFTHWQDERKKATFWTAHCGTLLLNEIGRRVGISSDLLKYASPREIEKIINRELSHDELQERRKESVFYWDTEGHDCLSGEETENIKTAILGSADLSDVDDFRGLTACMGKVQGKVKVVNSAKEIGKVEEGDILVAVMTRPDYVPAMKKAAAIVTDEGGITCHAAIVSRELGIPCIIGTKIATKILKDGMQVEVNANHGLVRIVS